MKNTITTQQPQGLSRRFWLSVLITSVPGQDLSFRSAIKDEVMLLLVWSRNFLLIFPLIATPQAAQCLRIIKRDMNLVLRKEHSWLSRYHQFSTIPLFSIKAFYSRMAQLRSFVIWQTCNTEEKKQRSSHDPEHSPRWVLRPAEVQMSRAMLGDQPWPWSRLASCIHPPGHLLLLARAGEQLSEQHLQLWQVNTSFTLANGQLLMNRIVCQVRGGDLWSGHIPFRACVQPRCWVVVPVPLQGILTCGWHLQGCIGYACYLVLLSPWAK